MRNRTEGGAIMPSAKIILCILSILGVCAAHRAVMPNAGSPAAQRDWGDNRAARMSWRLSAKTPPQPLAKGKRIMPVQKRIVIAATTVLDGRGRVLHDTRIVIEGSKIVALDPRADSKAGPVD